MVKGKLLACVLWDDATCKFRKSETPMMMVRCWRCREFKKFLREMGEDDVKIMDDIEKERGTGG
jgi:hypothetical protein